MSRILQFHMQRISGDRVFNGLPSVLLDEQARFFVVFSGNGISAPAAV
ncbi:MAG: hypothetical protein IKG23_00250 [Clostridia bacterium]|nr:hypothetical protein [Clostridia bacterium]